MSVFDTLKVRGARIFFQFEDAVRGGMFEEQRQSGLIMTTYFDDSAKIPRKAIVVAVGPDEKLIKVGDTILIEALRWTESMKIDKDTKVWMTDRGSVLEHQPC